MHYRSLLLKVRFQEHVRVAHLPAPEEVQGCTIRVCANGISMEFLKVRHTFTGAVEWWPIYNLAERDALRIFGVLP